MKVIYTGALVLLFSLFINAQTLLVENFEYTTGDLIDTHGWVSHSGTGVDIAVQAGSLSYPDYDLSGIGGSVYVTGGSGSRKDYNKVFDEQSSGTVFASLLVNVDSASASGDYFFHLGPADLGGSYRGRIFLKNNGAGKFMFGLSKTGGSGSIPAVYTTTEYDYGTTYLLVLKYEYFGTMDDMNDVVSLYINPALNGEPAAADLEHVDATAASSDQPMGSVSVRQGGNGYGVTVDAIRISTMWDTVVPVELSAFSASVSKNSVNLSWRTATETNNYGFEVLRDGKKLSFINGAGTATEEKTYSYTDKNVTAGKYTYSLVQIDLDGTRSEIASKEVNVTSVPSKFELGQNYPNPFNPSTKIQFSLAADSRVNLSVFNLLGEKVTEVVNGNMAAGVHTAELNGHNLQSGIYIYTLTAESSNKVTRLTKKMTLIK